MLQKEQLLTSLGVSNTLFQEDCTSALLINQSFFVTTVVGQCTLMEPQGV